MLETQPPEFPHPQRATAARRLSAAPIPKSRLEESYLLAGIIKIFLFIPGQVVHREEHPLHILHDKL